MQNYGQQQQMQQPPVNYQQPMVDANGAPLVYYGQPQFQPQPQTQPMIIYQPANIVIQPPSHPMTGTVQAGLKKTGLQKIEEQSGIFIKQKFEMLEAFTGCETENKYNVYSLNKDGNKKGKTPLFKCKEKSNLCSRLCLSGDCRPFKMTISTLVNRGGEDNDDEYEPFLSLERPCKFTCLCFERPELMVTLVEGGKNEYLGKIVDPFNWCNLQVNVFDKNNAQRYTIEGDCLQLGIWCRMPCEPCQTVDFQVKTPSGEVISGMQKRTAGCVKAAVSDTDNFALNFPANASVADKALLMCAVLLIDFRHFEVNPNRQNS